jgi:hypothetical protein
VASIGASCGDLRACERSPRVIGRPFSGPSRHARLLLGILCEWLRDGLRSRSEKRYLDYLRSVD